MIVPYSLSASTTVDQVDNTTINHRRSIVSVVMMETLRLGVSRTRAIDDDVTDGNGECYGDGPEEHNGTCLTCLSDTKKIEKRFTEEA